MAWEKKYEHHEPNRIVFASFQRRASSHQYGFALIFAIGTED